MRSKRKQGNTTSQVVQGTRKHKKKKNTQIQQSQFNRCERCNRTFKSSTALSQHNASAAHSRRDMPCPRCNSMFKTTSGIAQHLEAKCFCGITETVIKWDVNHQITSPIYTDRIQEVNSDAETDLHVVKGVGPGLQQIPTAWKPTTFHCPKCGSYFSLVSSLIQHIESGKCGLAERQEVKQIYTGMHDMFKGLIKN